jgi:ankyrin repeat protein
MVAAILGDSEILEIFLGSGASLTTRDRVKRTPLHYAASEGMIDCVNLLLSRKAPLDCKDFYGDLPLRCAVRCSSEEAVKAMLTEYPNPFQYLARFSKISYIWQQRRGPVGSCRNGTTWTELLKPGKSNLRISYQM